MKRSEFLSEVLRDNMLECRDCGLWEECNGKRQLCTELADEIDDGDLGEYGEREL